VVKPKEPPFLGQERMQSRPCERRLVGLLLKAGIPREGYPVEKDGREVGRVTSGGLSPVLNRGIALAWVEAPLAEEGTALEVVVRGRRQPARVHGLPFIRR
jgi:aminomethyltransferase